MSRDSLVRDMMPVDRISKARIRQWLMLDKVLDTWSRSGADAIRPVRLASLIRDCVWRAHDVGVDTVAERLARRPSKELVFRVEIEVDIPDQKLTLISNTHFRGGSGRIRAEIMLHTETQPHSITISPILLRDRFTQAGVRARPVAPPAAQY